MGKITAPTVDSGQADSPKRLDWPLPALLAESADSGTGTHERGLVTLIDGSKHLGTVLDVDFERGMVALQLSGGTVRKVPFSTLRSLYLTRTVQLGKPPADGYLHPENPQQTRRCTISFNDGTFLDVDVLSILPRKAGLFLYVPHYGNEVLRWFIPAAAMANYHMLAPAEWTSSSLVPAPTRPDAPTGPASARVPTVAVPGTQLAIVTPEQLREALVRPTPPEPGAIVESLIRDRVISAAQGEVALTMKAASPDKPLAEILAENGQISTETVRQVRIGELGVPRVDLTRFQLDVNALKALSPEIAHKLLVIPLYRTKTRIAIATQNPLDSDALKQLEFYTGLKVDPVMAEPDEIRRVIDQYYPALDSGQALADIVAELGVESRAIERAEDTQVSETDSTLVRFVNKMIMDASDHEASDIHVESMQGDRPTRIRLRIDGTLTPYAEVPTNFRQALISRLKIMAELDISERRRPQDGKINFENFAPRRLELRVLTMPTANGLEDVVLRVLSPPRSYSLSQLALSTRMLAQLKAMTQRSFGLVLVCGPTGSGKTTTLHSLLAHINTPQRKIWTVEDPVEITQDGLCQVQVNPRLGLTFPEVLRSFLRADPDVIMVGEMRDAETARTVVTASLTGHLVFSTMHTNSAAESIVRLLDLGLDPFNFSDALAGVLGQRLVRSLCPACRVPYQASPEEIQRLAMAYTQGLPIDAARVETSWRSRHGADDGSITLHSPGGCAQCDHSGYRGRLGVHELLVTSGKVKAAIQAHASAREITLAALEDGFTTLLQDGIEKILEGRLDWKQVQLTCL